MQSLICDAIKARHVLRFHYHGGTRIAEPFCYGRSAGGHELLRAFQFEGYSESGAPMGWKLFRVEDMTDVSVAADVRASYNPEDPAMQTLFCRV